MDPSTLTTFTELMTASGPYGLVAILGWAFWRVNNRKDQQLTAMYTKLVEIAEAHTAAVIKVEAALVALKEAIDGMRRPRP
jgi:predicted negative regulator of RcsB-dependent stress response